MSPHIIGRPGDGLLDLILGHDADPEQAIIGGREPAVEEGARVGDHPGDDPTVPES